MSKKNQEVIDINTLEKGYIKEGELNSTCYIVGKIEKHINEDVDLIDMGETYIIANKTLNKSIEIVKEEWEYIETSSGKYIFGVKGTSDKWIGFNSNYSRAVNCVVISDSDKLIDRIINLDTFKYENDLKDEINSQRQTRYYFSRLCDDDYVDSQAKLLVFGTILLLGAFLIRWLG